jgi:hypothetical protein
MPRSARPSSEGLRGGASFGSEDPALPRAGGGQPGPAEERPWWSLSRRNRAEKDQPHLRRPVAESNAVASAVAWAEAEISEKNRRVIATTTAGRIIQAAFQAASPPRRRRSPHPPPASCRTHRQRPRTPPDVAVAGRRPWPRPAVPELPPAGAGQAALR